MSSQPYNVLLVTGGGYHDFENGGRILRDALRVTGRFTVTEARLCGEQGIPEFAALPRSAFHAVVLYTQCSAALPRPQEDGLVQFIEGGGGLVGIHCAADSFTQSERFLKLLGSRFVSHPPGIWEFAIRFTDSARRQSHPLALRSNDFVLADEHYLLKPCSDFEIFATSHFRGEDVPMGYTRRHNKGMVVYLANGHYPPSLANRYFQRLLERSVRLACGETFPPRPDIRCGIIGYGGAFNMGKVHAEAINAQPGMKTVAVCDLDPQRRTQAVKELGETIRTHDQIDHLLANDGVDLVVVILPHHLHASTCIAASRAGKHVITEKPFCITLEEADAMIAASHDAGKMLSAFHNRRWDGDFLRILELVRGGEIGPVYHIEAATASYGMPRTWWRAGKEMSGGVLYDWGAHYGDWLLNLANKRVESVSGNLQKRFWHQSTNEDFAQVHVRFADGTTANIEQGALAAISRPGWRILGTCGGITNSGPHAEITLVQMPNGVRRETKLPGGPGTPLGYYQNVANHLLMNERLVVTAQQARRAIGLLRLAELSSQQGGVPLPLPGEEQFIPDYMVPW